MRRLVQDVRRLQTQGLPMATMSVADASSTIAQAGDKKAVATVIDDIANGDLPAINNALGEKLTEIEGRLNSLENPTP